MHYTEALQRLKDGNERFYTGSPVNPHRTTKRIKDTASGQKPFAVVFGCADSRVPPAVVFDAGIGDLFVIRNAGHICSTYALGSIEYAVSVLDTRLIVVLGHQSCGAVTAGLQQQKQSSSINAIVEAIQPAVTDVEKDFNTALHKTIINHIGLTVEKLKNESSLISRLTEDGGVAICGAYYRLETGQVRFLTEPSD